MNVLTASQIDIVLCALTPVVPDLRSTAGNFKSTIFYIDAATIHVCRVLGNLRIAAHGNLTVFTYIHSTAASGFIADDFRIIGHN